MAMKKKLTNKVVISQGGVSSVFRLSDKEMDGLRASSWDKEKKYSGHCYNFAMYAFFEYETSRAKYGRFASLFDYNKGDFYWYIAEK